MLRLLSSFVFVGLLLFSPEAWCRSLQEAVAAIPDPHAIDGGWVYDEADLLGSYKAMINSTLTELERDTSVEIGVAVLSSIGDEQPKAFATALFNHWGIGKADKDNGVLVLHVVDQRQVQIETGEGVHNVLPDSRCEQILGRITIPDFRRGQFASGHYQTVLALVSAIRQSPMEAGPLAGNTHGPSPADKLTRELSPAERAAQESSHPERVAYVPPHVERVAPVSDRTGGEAAQGLPWTPPPPPSLVSRILCFDGISRSGAITWLPGEYQASLEGQVLLLLSATLLIFWLLWRATSMLARWVDPGLLLRIHRMGRFLEYPIMMCAAVVVSVPSTRDKSYYLLVFFFSMGLPVFIRRWRVSRKLHDLLGVCPKCRRLATRLGEESLEQHLEPGQVVEHRVGSMAYEVWQCECGWSRTWGSVRWSSYRVCPECRVRAFHSPDDQNLSTSTFKSIGKNKEVWRCENCGHEALRTIPRRRRRRHRSFGSSSHRSSFGGGRSRGGGAGGRY